MAEERRRSSISKENLFQLSASGTEKDGQRSRTHTPVSSVRPPPRTALSDKQSQRPPPRAHVERAIRTRSPYSALSSPGHRYGLSLDSDGDVSPQQRSGAATPVDGREDEHAYADDEGIVKRTRRFQHVLLSLSALCTGLGLWGLARDSGMTPSLGFPVTLDGLTRVIYFAGVFVAGVVCLAMVLVWVALRRERAAQREAQVALIVHEVRTRLVHDEALVILHARDDWCPDDPQLWALVEQRMGQDSRVRVTKQLVAGEVQRVWRWLARPTPLSTPTAHTPAHNRNHNHAHNHAQPPPRPVPSPDVAYPTVPDLDS